MPYIKIGRVKYQRLGLKRNPFPSIPMYSDSQSVFFSEAYVKKEFRLLRKLIVKNCQSKSSRMAIYVFGSCGCGKSTLLRNFTLKFALDRHFLPIYCRFPFYGGLRSLYHEVVRRVDPSILRKLVVMVRDRYPLWPPSYFLRKASYASSYQTEWEMIRALRISAFYAIEAFQDLVSNLLWASKREKVVLFLDDLEHAWIRFTGVQRYRWEETLVNIIPALKRKLVLVLPLNRTVLDRGTYYSSRPYFGMYNWAGINLDRYIKFEPNVTVMMKKKDEEVLALTLDLANNSVNNKQGKNFVQNLLKNLIMPVGSASEVLQQMYFETRKAAQRSENILV